MDHLSKETLEWRTLIYLLLTTGMRRGEECALVWDSVDFKNRRIKICHAARRILHKGIEIKDPKTFTSNRYVNMTPDLEKLLLELKEKSSLSMGSSYSKAALTLTAPCIRIPQRRTFRS